MTTPQPVRALALAREHLPNGKDADYILRLLETKARHAEAKAPAKAKRVKVRNLLRKAGERPIGKSGLLREADLWFGRFIKMRDAQNAPDGSMYGVCVTCGEGKYLHNLQCGHWIRRENWGARFDERNCHAQCIACNGFKGGMEQEHEAYILKTYGAQVRDKLLMAKKIKGRKPTATALQNIAATYRAKAKELGWAENTP